MLKIKDFIWRELYSWSLKVGEVGLIFIVFQITAETLNGALLILLWFSHSSLSFVCLVRLIFSTLLFCSFLTNRWNQISFLCSCRPFVVFAPLKRRIFCWFLSPKPWKGSLSRSESLARQIISQRKRPRTNQSSPLGGGVWPSGGRCFLSLPAKTGATVDPTGERKQEGGAQAPPVDGLYIQNTTKFQVSKRKKKKRLKMKTLTDERESFSSVKLGFVAGFCRVLGV